ncbi:hypothetical protein [Amaricoccus sp. W119]|uniref:hypothetical protein n=1 Tax=Amaricoccus sp. W119 TaxID=3391833 RepID=UPI0039A6A21C
MTDAETAKGDVIVAAMKRAGTDDAGARATVVVTVYDKQDISGMLVVQLGRAEGAGNILYVRAEREGDGYRHTGASSLNASLSDTIKRLRVSSTIRAPRSTFQAVLVRAAEGGLLSIRAGPGGGGERGLRPHRPHQSEPDSGHFRDTDTDPLA